ncbi:MAG: heparan-alpha-glucosaminide N-acetyltransferase domain-containing protein [Candidatus Altiarchaeota archaeon]|nr:heparan-alpha-glucosaminide N-acetyltransferase domain-containing protein [Candidatus Altiarchaeota archaeon]
MKPCLKRFNSLDCLRGLAVILMFAHHFPRWLMFNKAESEVYGYLFIMSRLSAPLFLFIVGICLVLSAQRHKNHMLQHYLKRGFLLILIGFLLNLITPMDLLSFNILHTIGLSIILLFILLIEPIKIKCLLSILLLIPLSHIAYKSIHMKNILDMFQFPILPWIIFVIFGIAAGSFLTDFYRHKMNKFPRYLEFSALLSIILACALVKLGVSFNYTAYCTGPFIMLSTAAVLYTTAMFFWVYEVYKKNPVFLKPLIIYGRFAFFIYFIHHVFVYTIPDQLGFLNKFSETGSIISLLWFLIISWLALSIYTQVSDKPQH